MVMNHAKFGDDEFNPKFYYTVDITFDEAKEYAIKKWGQFHGETESNEQWIFVECYNSTNYKVLTTKRKYEKVLEKWNQKNNPAFQNCSLEVIMLKAEIQKLRKDLNTTNENYQALIELLIQKNVI